LTFTGLHGVVSQKTATVVETSHLTLHIGSWNFKTRKGEEYESGTTGMENQVPGLHKT
jgi:hypothetical protein